MSTTPTVSVEDIELFADDLDPTRAAAIYKEHGCLVVRGLMKQYVPAIGQDIERCVQQALAMLDQANKTENGWVTPDGTLFIPAPEGFSRDKQVMVTSCRYNTSATLFRSAFDDKLVGIVTAILGPDVELFMNGQCLYKEPVGGHPKKLHQDEAYFQHRYEGPVAVLCYGVDTDLVNGALHVVPGSHKLGHLQHVDTVSHLGLDEDEWPWERALPVCGQAGDAIFFHVRTIHGSKENHSSGPRPVFIHRYRRADDFVIIGGTNTANRAEAEKRAAEAKKENQLGFMVSGYRSYEGGRES